MRRFIKNTFLYVLLLIICMSPFILLILYFENQAYACKTLSPYAQINRIYNMRDMNADVIITGNSRAGHYIDSILSKELGIRCINIGWGGVPFNFQYHVMIKTYLSQNKKPKYIIQEIGPWAFLDYVIPKYSIEMLPYLNRSEFHFLGEICPEITTLDRFRLIRYRGQMLSRSKELLNIHGITSKYPSRKGFQRNYIRFKHSLECDPTIIELFKTYVEECINNNIEIIFVCSPIHDEGQQFFDMDGFWSIFNDIARSNNIKVLNYQDLYGNDTAYFGNSMHLNKYGKECFSKKIAHDLDSLYIIPAH